MDVDEEIRKQQANRKVQDGKVAGFGGMEMDDDVYGAGDKSQFASELTDEGQQDNNNNEDTSARRSRHGNGTAAQAREQLQKDTVDPDVRVRAPSALLLCALCSPSYPLRILGLALST